jgi:microcystin-dependent protein
MDWYLGEIRLFSWGLTPRYWAACNGTLLAITQNTALFSLLGTMYGGDGITNFALPDLQGRVAMHRSSTYLQGEEAGEMNVTLDLSDTPAHGHTFGGLAAAGDKRVPTNNLLATNSANLNFYGPPNSLQPLNPTSIAPAGGNLPHSNVQPFLVMNYCIATSGIYPPRG